MAVDLQAIARTPDDLYNVLINEICAHFIRDLSVLDSPQAKGVLFAIRRGVDVAFGLVSPSRSE